MNPAADPYQQMPEADPKAATRRLGNRLLWSALALGLGITAIDALDRFHRDHALMLNRTQSLPNWAFYMTKNAYPKRGDYVSFAPPVTPLVASHFGQKPDLFGKIVTGVGGDTVSHVGSEVLINGVRVATIKPVSLRGETLVPGPTGTVPANCYFVSTPSRDGFDSRYADIGFVCRHQIFGTGVPIL